MRDKPAEVGKPAPKAGLPDFSLKSAGIRKPSRKRKY
jgi:hypothetical protein